MNHSTNNLARASLEERESFTRIIVNREQFLCDWEGCLFWPDEELLIVSDLHLEKGASFARRGQLVPPYDTAETLNRLAKQIAYWQPKKLISLGDSFHDKNAHTALPEIYINQISQMMRGIDWIWISGNHDPIPPKALGGVCAEEINIGPITFCHEPRAGENKGEIAGHLHPKAKIDRRSKRVSRPCFVTDEKRLIMPSFGAYTGGLNIRHSAFEGLFDPATLSAVLLGNERVFHIAGRSLVA